MFQNSRIRKKNWFKAEKLLLQSLVSLFKLIGNISSCLLKSCKCNVATPSLLSNTYLNHQNHLQYLIQQEMKWKVELLDTLISSLVPSTSVSAHRQKTTAHKGPNPVKWWKGFRKLQPHYPEARITRTCCRVRKSNMSNRCSIFNIFFNYMLNIEHIFQHPYDHVHVFKRFANSIRTTRFEKLRKQDLSTTDKHSGEKLSCNEQLQPMRRLSALQPWFKAIGGLCSF